MELNQINSLTGLSLKLLMNQFLLSYLELPELRLKLLRLVVTALSA
jgi:hypothetical protein